MIKRIWPLSLPFALLCLVAALGGAVAYADTSDSSTYGSGNYGKCEFGSCTITLLSSGSTNLNVTPTPSGACSVASDAVSVQTSNDTGYTLTINTSTTNNAMTGGSSIGASAGTAASPVTLAMNTWGYRVDGAGGFGAGPTSGQSNGSVPSVPFAGVPASNQTGSLVAYSNTIANPAQQTTVWYGLCVNGGVPSGAYSVSVTYTAITN